MEEVVANLQEVIEGYLSVEPKPQMPDAKERVVEIVI